MIQQIWFDFGNIFIPVHPMRTRVNMERCGVQLSPEAFEDLHIEFEKGLISEKEFFQELSASCKFLQSASCVKSAWNSMLDPMEDRVLFLSKLRRTYKTALVSNTNATHLKEIERVAGPFLWNQFMQSFDGLFFSHEIGQRKPDVDFFDHLLDAMDVLPEQVLFIDDTAANLETASNMGIHTWQFNIQDGDLVRELPSVLAKLNQGAPSALRV